jgi:hypothetical protein
LSLLSGSLSAFGSSTSLRQDRSLIVRPISAQNLHVSQVFNTGMDT